MNLNFSTLQEIASELKKSAFSDLHLLPFNRFDIEHNDWWWLLAASDKAAFQFPKLAVLETAPIGLLEQVFCGLHIEKGVIADASTNPNHTMQPNWFWHHFAETIRERLSDDIQKAEEISGCSILIRVDCGPPQSPEGWASVTFSTDPPTLSRTKYKPSDGQLKNLSEVLTFDELANEIDKITTAERFRWVNVLIGATFDMNQDGPNDLSRCAEMLRPFSEWLDLKQ